MTETEAQRLFPQVREFLGLIEACNGQVIFRRTEILSDRENVNTTHPQITENIYQFLRRFAQADHDTAFCHHAWREFLRVFEQRECPLISCSRTHGPIEPGHSLCVVVEHVRPSFKHDPQRLFNTLKIGNEHFDSAIRGQFADCLYGFGKNARASNVVVIAIHASDNGMFQPQSGDGFRHAAWLFPIDRLRTAFRYGAEPAPPRTDVTQKHESRGLMVPALADVGALRRFAYGVQTQTAGQLLQIMEVVAPRSSCPKPLWLRRPQWRTNLNLD